VQSSPSEAEILNEYTTRWSFIAHEGQIPPRDKDWFVYLMRSGRGGGKTRAGAEWVLDKVRGGARMIALVGETKADVRDFMIDVGQSSILKVARPHERPIYEPSKRRLTWPNGAIALGFSGDEPDQLRGAQFDVAWVDELAKFKYAKEAWDNLMFCMRTGKNPQVFVTTTPRPIPIIKELVKAPDTIDVRFSTFQNMENLSPQFIDRIKQKYEGTRLGRQELYGEILDDVQGALWTYDLIENLRVRKCPVELQRIVVAVDPAVSSEEDSDETGIVVAGLGVDGRGYVLDDLSGIYSPNEWASRVVAAYDKYHADRVVAEVNNGGELVRANIQTVRKNIPYTAVHASRGKHVRAEPVHGLYEQGKINHIGSFSVLEDQMCNWVQGSKDSPDRMDAMVWGFTNLMLSDEAWVDIF